LDQIPIAVLDGVRTLADVPITPEQAEQLAAELLQAAARAARGAP
jgi:hypothetical protein